MRLRTSTKANHLKEEESPEPSTSRYGAADSLSSSPSPKNSPASPTGRVAKRNARLLNGLDLGGAHHAGGYSADSLVGTIPDFVVRRLQDFCPSIGQVLDDEHELDDGLLVSWFRSLPYLASRYRHFLLTFISYFLKMQILFILFLPTNMLPFLDRPAIPIGAFTGRQRGLAKEHFWRNDLSINWRLSDRRFALQNYAFIWIAIRLQRCSSSCRSGRTSTVDQLRGPSFQAGRGGSVSFLGLMFS